jgi:ATP-dependent Clp protease ATP-binding subunit ClpA
VFERFTNAARHVVVLAQDEAREMQHNFIGTEHELLGLLGEPEGLAARVLEGLGLSLAMAREDVAARVTPGKTQTVGHLPFTPRAKKVLELSLREALALRHNYIGTEHLLLGLIREGEGVGAQIIAARVGDLARVRMAVLDVLPPPQSDQTRLWLRRRGATFPTDSPGRDEVQTTPAADNSLTQAVRLAGSQPVGSQHLLLAALGDSDSAAARALATLGIDLDQACDALRTVDVTGTSDEPPEAVGRRQMLIRATDERLTLEVTDQTLLSLAHAAFDALKGQTGEPNTIRGDLAVSVSLSKVWVSLRDSLEDIHRRTIGLSSPAANTAETDPSHGERGSLAP